MKKMNPRIIAYFRNKKFESTLIGNEIDPYEI